MKRLLFAVCAALLTSHAYAGGRSGVDGTLDVTSVDPPTSAQYPHFICASGCSSTAPLGAVSITASSNVVANGTAQACLAAAVGKTTYITGFQVTATGATAALVVTPSVAGTISGTNYYTFVFPAGVTTLAQPLLVSFPVAVPATTSNAAICVTLPASGAGGTNATVSVQGFQL